ncbi:FAD/NAD(P)-binding domain-containing protein [Rhizoclosmatium globosum]|uniref:FAD/NAD(P)-binding domain-containing protein n=1 Tax=Rhizoclosmatium globosum TaxID=329046 RepID=A0A1Y2BNP0_9FUNG|nr:FAD/NAD(P)-binding domain-containing protein [Rhizoclosmatium globosum]|eukprot:ORY36370.1 FAD/NAD(P)-binding domain-containing protein [Rhizoclosmatium globosum]
MPDIKANTTTTTSSTSASAPKRVAIIGSGISGLSAAWLLNQQRDKYSVSLLEAGKYFGGHSNTVTIDSLDGSKQIGVDTGFIVCNPITYPNFLNFLDALKVPLQESDMSFSVSRNKGEFEWNGNNLNTLFAQRENLLSRDMWSMVSQVLRFNTQADQIAQEADDLEFDRNGNVRKDSSKAHPFSKMTLADFFAKFGYDKFFYQNYIVPMTAAIWSTPANMTFEKFPLLTLVRFMRNHILLQVSDRPKWMTVDGGSRVYVQKVISQLADARLNVVVTSVVRNTAEGTVTVTDSTGKKEVFDHVIFATHSDQALKILGDDATAEERQILGSIKFLNNRAVLHRDEELMPKRKLAWASWNYLTSIPNDTSTTSQKMCLTYWMDNLQPHINPKDFGHVFVTMNPLYEPNPSKVIAEFSYTHPLYSPETIAAQDSLNAIQNTRMTSFAGAWTNYGFHEDGITSGLVAAGRLGAECPFEVLLNGGYPTKRVVPKVPGWVEEKGWEGLKVGKPRFVDAEARKQFLKGVLSREKGAKDASGLGSVIYLAVAVIVIGVAVAVMNQ